MPPRRAVAVAFGSSLLLGVACTSAPQSASRSASARADAERLLADVRWLADDAQNGRRAGSADALRCGEWLAERFRGLGLLPAGEDGYLQRFEVPLPPVDRGGSRLASAETTWSGAGAVVPADCSDGGRAAGELAFAGYGVENDELGWNDFELLGLAASDALAGRVALVVRGDPPHKSEPAEIEESANVVRGAEWGQSASIFTKVMNCKRRGAVAVLVAEHPGHPEPLSAFDAAAARQSSLPVLRIGAHVLGEIAPAASVALGLLDRLEVGSMSVDTETPGTFEVVADVERAKGAAANVLGLLPGRSHERAIVVGAHYDHLGLGGPESLAPGERAIHNGADDNASGTAALCEIARLLGAGEPPACDVVFAAWSGEELGLLGSRHWLEHPTLPLARVEANLNLDMVGRAGAGRLQVLAVASAAPFEGWLATLAPRHGLELATSAGGDAVGGSDHQPFLERRVPALHLFSGVHADYHRPSDDVERFEADGAAAVSELAADLVREMAAAGDLVFVEPPKDASQDAARAPSRGRGTWFGSVPEYAFEGPGVKLAGTSAGSPAEKAGLRKDDVLLQVGDVRIDTMQDFVYALGLYAPGDTVLARFLRDGREDSVRVTLATRSKP